MKLTSIFEAASNEQKLRELLTPEFFEEHHAEVLRSILGRLSGAGIDRVWEDLSILGKDDEVGFNMEAMLKNLQKAYPNIEFRYNKYPTRYEITATLFELSPNWHLDPANAKPHSGLWFYYREGKYEVTRHGSGGSGRARKFDKATDALTAVKKTIEKALQDEKTFRAAEEAAQKK